MADKPMTLRRARFNAWYWSVATLFNFMVGVYYTVTLWFTWVVVAFFFWIACFWWRVVEQLKEETK